MDKKHCNVPVPRVPDYQKEPQDEEAIPHIVQNKDMRPPARDDWLGLLCPDYNNLEYKNEPRMH